jgi:hypothetical protein
VNIVVRPCNPESLEWEKLVQTSHQTSLFVSSSWLNADRPVVIGAFENGELISGVVAREFSDTPCAPYQGLLLSARSKPVHTHALLDWLEGIGGMPVVWNAPSLIDIRPFLERADKGVVWKEHIRYTYFVSTPFVVPHPELGAEKTNERIQRLAGSLAPGNVSRVLMADCVSLYEDGDALVAWGVDAQGRGYLVAFDGPYVPLAKRLIKSVESCDLGGTPSWAKEFGPKLRTSYGCVRVV